MSDARAATLPHVLREQIMDSRIPKNEREHWAARHIAELEAKCDRLAALVGEARELLNDLEQSSLHGDLYAFNGTAQWIALCDDWLASAALDEAQRITDSAADGGGGDSGEG